MESIKDRAAIVGMGCTRFGELWDKDKDDLMVDACYEAFEDAGIEPKDIQAAWLGTCTSGRTGGTLAAPLKLKGIPITRVENVCASGTESIRNACYAVASGVYDIVLACGMEKQKDCGFPGLPSFTPQYPEEATSQVRPLQPPVSFFALMANRYFYHYGIDYNEGKRALAKITVKNHHNGVNNPKAHLRREVTIEQVINAPMIATPLGLYDCCGVSDGSAAAIITRPEIAKKMRKDYILVKGLGASSGYNYAHTDADFDFVHHEENMASARMAYRDAGITNPREEIDMAIVHDCFTINELLTYEGMGFSQPGKAIEDINAGFFEMDGGLPVNTDGGLKCFGHPIGASGIRMAYEVYKQLQGKCGERQLKKDVKLGLTHNLGGPLGQAMVTVAIFGRAD